MTEVLLVPFAEVNSKSAALRKSGASVKAKRLADGTWELTITHGKAAPMSQPKRYAVRQFPKSSGFLDHFRNVKEAKAEAEQLEQRGAEVRVVGKVVYFDIF